MTTILNGLLGGLLVGLVAAVVSRLVSEEPSATAVLLEGIVGNRATTSQWREVTVPILYGGLAGGVLLVLELFVLQTLAVPPTVGEALGVALAWSAPEPIETICDSFDPLLGEIGQEHVR